MSWQIEVFSETFREADMTVGLCAAAERIAGVDWRALHPLQSASAARAICAVLLMERTGRDLAAVLADIDAMRVDVFLASYSEVR